MIPGGQPGPRQPRVVAESSAEIERDTLAGVVENVLEQYTSLGVSGRWFVEYGVSPSDLAYQIAAALAPLLESGGKRPAS